MTVALDDVTYLLPIRMDGPPSFELTAYLRRMSRESRVLVVDGSPPAIFDAAHDAWHEFAQHVAPDPARACANGKVHGVLTGLDLVDTPVMVIADDDVRYDAATLRACVAALDGADLVRPQNHFAALPWHARWDTARTLLNRALAADFPGTLVVRVATLRAAGGYDGDVLFENLELMRTIDAVGGVCVSRPDLYVPRLPPTASHFLSQRVRQAYDEFARPRVFALELSVLPLVVLATLTRRFRLLAGAAGALVALAAKGRAMSGGAGKFPATSTLLAPVWVLERAVTSWLAVGERLRGGVRYGGTRLVRAASTPADRSPR